QADAAQPPATLCSSQIFAQPRSSYSSFFGHAPGPAEICPLSLHDALPICADLRRVEHAQRLAEHAREAARRLELARAGLRRGQRSEEHTSELQSQSKLVCPLLLEKKKWTTPRRHSRHTQTPNALCCLPKKT